MSSQDDDVQFDLAIIALIISLVALGATVLQVLQQMVVSATGYQRVGRRVLDFWFKSRKLQVHWTELRMEVKFETPVLFLCPPGNKNFPNATDEAFFLHRNQEENERRLLLRWKRRTTIYFLTRGWASWLIGKTDKDTAEAVDQDRDAQPGYILPFFKSRNKPPARKGPSSVSTINAERASWLLLLDGIYSVEEQSHEWQGKNFPTDWRIPPDNAMRHRTVMICMQVLDRSWDMMPANLQKPYATTTMCHLIEMTAMLCIYWRDFERRKEIYRAEGNGFTVMGQNIAELGLTFTFLRGGKARFEENRVIPADGIKDLCFGRVQTIYAGTVDIRRLEAAEVENMGALQVSTSEEIVESLRVLGCNTSTVNYFLFNQRVTHIFPIAFELLGMLAQTFHIKNTLFRFLPNPTKFTWDRKEFSIRGMMFAFGAQLREHCECDPAPVKLRILELLQGMTGYYQAMTERPTKGKAHDLKFLNCLHDNLDEVDEVLTARKKEICVSNDAPLPSQRIRRRQTVLDFITVSTRPATSHSEQFYPPPPSTKLSPETAEQIERRKMVRDVLRSHVQTVLQELNPEEEEGARSPESTHGFRVSDLDNAPPEGEKSKHKILMEMYFGTIRRHVVQLAQKTTIDRHEEKTMHQQAFTPVATSNRRGSDPAICTNVGFVRFQPTQTRRSSTFGTNDPGSTRQTKDDGASETIADSASIFRFERAAFRSEDSFRFKRTRTLQSGGDQTLYESGAEVEEASLLKTEGLVVTAPVIVSGYAPVHAPPTVAPQIRNRTIKLELKQDEHGAAHSARVEERLVDLPDLSHDDIWCALVFRMMCWLTLHDFNKRDRQIPSSGLMGSRLPVFIA